MSTHYRANDNMHNPSTRRFIFATGIECSYPTIGVDGRTRRIDQLEKCGHYDRWREDFELTREMGIHYLRYGPPYYRMHLGPGRYDWGFTDTVLPELRRMGIVPIIDLCHFGVPDWLENFQNPDFPRHFAEFAGAFARRYPWIWCYTPVNEMYITAEFSAYFGWWNERLTTDESYVTALKHVAEASVRAMRAIIDVRPDCLFVMCESSENTHARRPELINNATFFNERRFLSLDLCCGRMVSSGMYRYLRDNGMSEDEYRFFLDTQLTEHIVMGHDYYETNERVLVNETERVEVGDVFGYYVIAKHYHERYNLPIMHTETNAPEGKAVDWLWRTFDHIQKLREDGVPLCGMTWYSLTHQMDWDTALREENNRVHPVGLFDLDRNITPVGEAYRELIETWKDTPLLPNGPLSVVGQWDHPTAERVEHEEEEHEQHEAAHRG